ncbi:hypothetical protein FisN_3Lh516 [Fistulifera solaris]|uniref:Coenzyme Q-binding protein COQ10 START domain-containing protein n=1 Tax=Fistulifera solaris TaxID=1519565 RepID=A0A1Z5J8I6_FISSO|nr:hypothetical protein FisN_3Lh516 [Fistulifera solaris]|eukprot:GAX10313.1 hypothetical protein FisN_3Lh516 [Fistulifera solaris]
MQSRNYPFQTVAVLLLLLGSIDAFGLPKKKSRRHTPTTTNHHHPLPASRPLPEERKARLKQRVTNLVKTMSKPIALISPVGAVLSNATLTAMDMAVEDLQQRQRKMKDTKATTTSENDDDLNTIISDTFRPLEDKLLQLEQAVQETRAAIEHAKRQTRLSLQAVQAATLEQAIEGALVVVEQAEEEAASKALADMYVAAVNSSDVDISTLAFEDVDYGTSEMAPPFLDDDQCLVPGEPVVRVEKAPENSRRIFAGIDIMASVEDVWNVLTDYSHLQDVVPNLVVNEVLQEYSASERLVVDKSRSESEQCQQLAQQMKGALLRQVGGAKIAGLQFSARTTLEVREWPQGLPDFAHFQDDVWEGKSRKQRANDLTTIPLERYKFPRPFAVSKLPTRDISMQSIENDDGEFRMYQGVWRMQPLPGCSPPGTEYMRLTYAVEVSPRAYLPVRMIEGRIVRDLCSNLVAIRNYLSTRTLAETS